MSEITQEGNIFANETARDPAGLVGTNQMMYNFKKTGREGPGANFIINIQQSNRAPVCRVQRSPFLNNKVITSERKEMGKCPSLKEKFKTVNKSGARR